jgi:hypothetical protein
VCHCGEQYVVGIVISPTTEYLDVPGEIAQPGRLGMPARCAATIVIRWPDSTAAASVPQEHRIHGRSCRAQRHGRGTTGYAAKDWRGRPTVPMKALVSIPFNRVRRISFIYPPILFGGCSLLAIGSNPLLFSSATLCNP